MLGRESRVGITFFLYDNIAAPPTCCSKTTTKPPPLNVRKCRTRACIRKDVYVRGRRVQYTSTILSHSSHIKNKQTIQRKKVASKPGTGSTGVQLSNTHFCNLTLAVGSIRSQDTLCVLSDFFDAMVGSSNSHHITNAGEDNTKKQGGCYTLPSCSRIPPWILSLM